MEFGQRSRYQAEGNLPQWHIFGHFACNGLADEGLPAPVENLPIRGSDVALQRSASQIIPSKQSIERLVRRLLECATRAFEYRARFA
jgi:hypothetical protein